MKTLLLGDSLPRQSCFHGEACELVTAPSENLVQFFWLCFVFVIRERLDVEFHHQYVENSVSVLSFSKTHISPPVSFWVTFST